MDTVAATDQAVEEMKALARIHGAYFMQLVAEAMDRDEALSSTHTLMWTNASNCNHEEDED